MKWYRSWPNHPAVGAYVMDSTRKLYMHSYDYLTIKGGWPQEDLILMEWDIAIDRHDRIEFERLAMVSADEVLVAPYRLRGGRWVHGKDRDNDGTYDPVEEYDVYCNWFGMGCIYLPYKTVKEWLATKPDRWTDGVFSEWYNQKYGPTLIAWNVRVAHLNT